MNRLRRGMGLALFCWTLVCCMQRVEAATGPTLLVVPARESMVRVAMDMVALRPVAVVSYRESADPMRPYLYVWDADGERWVELSAEALEAADRFLRPPQQCVIVGAGKKQVSALADMLSWCPAVLELTSLDTVTVFNGLDSCLHFTPSEWERLAGRHNLSLLDRNAERRRYGRYGPPGKERDRRRARDGEPLWPAMDESAAPFLDAIEGDPEPLQSIVVVPGTASGAAGDTPSVVDAPKPAEQQRAEPWEKGDPPETAPAPEQVAPRETAEPAATIDPGVLRELDSPWEPPPARPRAAQPEPEEK